MQILDIKTSDRILIVAPHPDDECIGAGGLLASYPNLCSVIVLTDGRLGQGDVDPDVEKEIRKQEFIREMQFLDITDYQMLNYEDGTLMKHKDCLESVDLSRYTKIFTTGIRDNHPDHTAACISVCRALEKQHLHNIEIYLYEVHSPLREVTHLLDITEVIGQKLNLIRFHQSQLGGLPYDRLANSMAEYRALQNRMKEGYVEAFTCMSPQSTLDSSSIELEEKLQKNIQFYQLLTRWLGNKIEGHNMAVILSALGYLNIAVYGYAELGKLLCKELQNTDVNVVYIMDKKIKRSEENNICVFFPAQGLPFVDAVIVTAVYYFEDIKENLSEMGFKNIISLKELVEQNGKMASCQVENKNL